MKRALIACLLLLAAPAHADDATEILDYLDRQSEKFAKVAQDIWDYAELGYLENKSTSLLQSVLAAEGFEIQAGVADIPTAFVASYGEGEPVIGILAEFDALPGISQSRAPTREVLEGKDAGHACGHHLFGAGSAAAAIAVRRWIENNNVKGTVRLYGTPAEEGGSGKVYLVRAGLFDDVDTVLHWHPSDRNAANAESSLANKSARFKFRGISSHAAAAPDRGRSALDGVEAMNFMVNLMREHVPQETRIHYIVSQGGKAPNVVPDYAENYYYVRHPNAAVLQTIWDRVITIATAAAEGTGTDVDVEVMHGNHSVLPNRNLAEIMHQNLSRVGGVYYSTAEQVFAEKLSQSFEQSFLGMETEILPLEIRQGMGSTDVGDVSWVVPTAGMRAATWVPGTAAHSWQAIASGGTSIGGKGMMVAAKTLALTAKDLMRQPALIQAGRQEFDERRGVGFIYKSLLGDRKPPLDYRLP